MTVNTKSYFFLRVFQVYFFHFHRLYMVLRVGHDGLSCWSTHLPLCHSSDSGHSFTHFMTSDEWIHIVLWMLRRQWVLLLGRTAVWSKSCSYEPKSHDHWVTGLLINIFADIKMVLLLHIQVTNVCLQLVTHLIATQVCVLLT